MAKNIYMYAGNTTSVTQNNTSKASSPGDVWKWGSDNLFPTALAKLAQCSTIHRRIINDKSDYIAGRGFEVAGDNARLQQIVDKANGRGESLRSVLQKVSFDKCLFGNAFLEIVTDEKRTFISLFHQDSSRCRLGRDKQSIVMHHDWAKFTKKDAVQLPIYPMFKKGMDGFYHSMLHYKDYEPMAENYGFPKYIAALGSASIAYKTDRWNVSRLDNAFQVSGVMVLDGEVDTPDEAAQIAKMAEKKFAGKPGQVMFMVKNSVEGDSTKFVPINSSADGDWRGLHEQAMHDIVVAHSWFVTLSGLNYSTGFSADRIVYEYHIALNSVIRVEQKELIEPIVEVMEQMLRLDCSSLVFVNRPPFEQKPPYMKVWEARRADGLEYDEQDELQQRLLSEI